MKTEVVVVIGAGALGMSRWLRRTYSVQSLRRLSTNRLVATKGPASGHFGALFAGLGPDPKGSLDGVRDMAGMPLDEEPARDLDAIKARHSGG